MSTPAILPGFTLTALTAPQPGAPSGLSASAFSDLLSAFAGAGQSPDGQVPENPEATDPESVTEPAAPPVSGLGQLGGWPLPAPFTGEQPQLRPSLPLEAHVASQPTHGLMPAAPFEPLSGAEPVAADSVPATSDSSDVPQAGDGFLPPQKPAAFPSATETITPAVAAAVPVPAEQADRRTSTGQARQEAKLPGPDPASVPATAPVSVDTALNPSAQSASSATSSVVLAGTLAAPRPATADIESPHGLGQAIVEEALTSVSGPRMLVVTESSPLTSESILQPVPAATAAVTDAPKAPGNAPAVMPGAAAPQPMAAQLARPVFALATEAPGQHVMTMKVSPEDLGPVTVRAHISSEGVRLEMFAAGDAGRDAVRAALPELRRELALQGLTASLDLSGRNSPEHGQSQPQHHRGNQDQGGPYRSNLRMVNEAEPIPGQPARTLSSTAALDVVA